MLVIEKGKFEPGNLYCTAGVNEAIKSDPAFELFVNNCFKRHVQGDWGDMVAADKKENEFSLNKYLRIFSAYNYTVDGNVIKNKIWIITEAGRKTTTILFPDEY